LHYRREIKVSAVGWLLKKSVTPCQAWFVGLKDVL
jgi:hypothetical protein